MPTASPVVPGRARRFGPVAVVGLWGAVTGCAFAIESRAGDERLVVFSRDAGGAVARTFAEEQLPRIREAASNLGLPVQVIDVALGAPEEVTVTPLVSFQDRRGRSFYHGRLTTVDRIVNFVRTSRVVIQGDAPLERRDIPILSLGRARVGAPIKIAPVTGAPPRGYEEGAMRFEAVKAIKSGLRRFKMRSSATFGRSDRLFYMDFYPWVSDDGTLFLSTALYSQFHCKEPIFRTAGEDLSGPWKNRRELFRRAARLLEDAALRAIEDPAHGDGFDAVPSGTPVVSWESLGLSIGNGPKAGTAAASAGPPLPQRWMASPPRPGDAPLIVFRFPAPLDGYAGEVRNAGGVITLATPHSLAGASAEIVADPTTVTTGEPDLDHALQGATYLHSGAFPVSRFVLERITGEELGLNYGRQTHVVLSGPFEMKGVRVPISARATMEPILGDDATPRLTLVAGFELDLRAFQIPGPDGPEPARHTLLIDVALTFAPPSEE